MPDDRTNNRFEITLPDDWVDQSMYIFNGPEVGGIQHNLTLVIDQSVEDNDLDRFATERLDAVLSVTPNMELLKKEVKALANGNQVCDAVVKWIPVDGKIIFQKRVYMILGGRGYTFLANFTKQTMKTIGLQVEQMINSFRPEAS
ncbi:MAG: DcrB-related protein [Candidatus Zixiibacteriota bacterium]